MEPKRPGIKVGNVVGPSLRRFRLKAGLTQKELASACEGRGLLITRSTLAKIESQVRYVKACELHILGLILKVPLARFYPSGFGSLNKGDKHAASRKKRLELKVSSVG